MTRRALPGALLLLLIATAPSAVPAPAVAAEIWSGRTFGFSKPAFGDPLLPANQDRITPLVWITRASSQGIFNIAQEPAYAANLSPKDTRWARGDAVNHASLTFQPWQGWTANNPGATIGVNAVVHLVTEDIYIDIVFDSFTAAGAGSAFSYRRGLPPATPARATSWGRIKSIYR